MHKNDLHITNGADKQQTPIENAQDTAQRSDSHAKEKHPSMWEQPSPDALVPRTDQAKLQQAFAVMGKRWVQDRTGTKEGEIPPSGSTPEADKHPENRAKEIADDLSKSVAEHAAERQQNLSKIGQRWVRDREIKDAGDKFSNERRREDNEVFPVIKEQKSIEAYPQRLHGEAARAAHREAERVARNARLDSAVANLERAIESPASRNIAAYHKEQIHHFNAGDGRNPDTGSDSNDHYQSHIDAVEQFIHHIARTTQRYTNATEQEKTTLRALNRYMIDSIDDHMQEIVTYRDIHDMIVLGEKVRSFYHDIGYVSQY